MGLSRTYGVEVDDLPRGRARSFAYMKGEVGFAASGTGARRYCGADMTVVVPPPAGVPVSSTSMVTSDGPLLPEFATLTR